MVKRRKRAEKKSMNGRANHLGERRGRIALRASAIALAVTCGGWATLAVGAARAYEPIDASLEAQTITLTGRDLTIEQIVAVARHGAKVQLSESARQRESDNYGLLLEATAEGIPIYGFNRGAGDKREVVIFKGDALSAENKPKIERIEGEAFRSGVLEGLGPEVDQEEVVRALLVVRANAMTHNAPSPQLAQMLLDLLNHRITPVVQSRGTVGEADLAQLENVAGAMVGVGEVYYRGKRMPASQALSDAGLQPLHPFGSDVSALVSSNAYATGEAALAVYDAERALEWADLAYTVDLNGMNSSVTPLSLVVQCDRPEKWLNWDAARVLAMLKGSYLFESDPARIIQDPESLRASSIRQGAAWEEWGALKDAVVFQANTSDHNPAVRTGLGPTDSWELATPQLMRFYVKGGPESHGQHGFVVSNANWDPYPLANKLENFVTALGNMDIAVTLRMDRFNNTFFTVVKASDVLHGELPEDWGYTPVALQQQIQTLMSPVSPSGAAIVSTVEDLQAQTHIKVERVQQAVGLTFDLISFDLLRGALWMDVRKAQNARRAFGPGATAVWTALRKEVPLMHDPGQLPERSDAARAGEFIRVTDPDSLFRDAVPAPTAGISQECKPPS
jgi:histidine ammonia-lyase